MGSANRELGPRLKAAVAASTELRERDALKHVGLAAAMTTALLARGIPDPTAHLPSEMGVLASKQGYARWSENDHHACASIDTLAGVSASLGAVVPGNSLRRPHHPGRDPSATGRPR